MQKTVPIKAAVAKEIESASKGNIAFEFDEIKCTGVTIKVDDEYTFKVVYRDYGIHLLRLVKEVEFCVSYEAEIVGSDELVTVTKKFETEDERSNYISCQLMPPNKESIKLFTQDL